MSSSHIRSIIVDPYQNIFPPISQPIYQTTLTYFIITLQNSLNGLSGLPDPVEAVYWLLYKFLELIEPKSTPK